MKGKLMRNFKKMVLKKIGIVYRYYLTHLYFRILTWVILFLWAIGIRFSVWSVVRLIILLIYRHFCIFPIRKRKVVNTVLGPPGSGKTTLAAFWALKSRLTLKSEEVYCNVPIKGVTKFSWEDDFGTYMIKDATIIIDEAGLELDNRNFAMNFTDVIDKKTGKLVHNGRSKLETAKLHRHYGLDILLLSQWTDQDIKLRNLSQNYWVMKKTGFPWLLHAKLYDTDIDVDPMSGDFRMVRVKKHSYFIFSPVVWFDFVTDDYPELPEKDSWKKYSD